MLLFPPGNFDENCSSIYPIRNIDEMKYSYVLSSELPDSSCEITPSGSEEEVTHDYACNSHSKEIYLTGLDMDGMEHIMINVERLVWRCNRIRRKPGRSMRLWKVFWPPFM